MTDTADDAASERQEEAPPFWEWVVAGVGLVLLLSALAFLGYEATIGDEGPPAPTLHVVAVDKQRAGYLVRLRVRNEARATAAALRVAGVLTQGEREVERSDTEFQFVPGRSEREGGLFFRNDPAAFHLQVRPESYQKP